MAFRTRANEAVRTQFNEVRNSGVFIAWTEANREDSMRLLQQNGLRALTYQEAIVKIDQNPELKDQLKGKWFYLIGKGSVLSRYYTFNDKGELTQGKGDIEKTVHAWKGSQPLSFFVLTDGAASTDGRRYVLGACYSPVSAAWVVVGVPIGHKVAAPKIKVSTTEGGVKLTGITAEQLIILQRDSA